VLLSAQWGGSNGIEAQSLGPLILQCFDTVGWVFWPIKSVPDMTYDVFGGTLNLAQFNLVREYPRKKLKCQQRLQAVAIAVLLVGRPSSRQWQMTQSQRWLCWRTGVTQKWLVKHTVLNNMTILCTKYYQNLSMSVEDIASQSSVICEHDRKEPFSGFRIPTVVQSH